MGLQILIIRFSSIGDIVLTSPVMRCIKNKYPDAHITYVCKEVFRPIVSANPYIDEVVTLRRSFAEMKSQLKNRSFDYIIDLHNNLRSKRLAIGLSGKYRSFNKLNIEKWLLVNFKIQRLPNVHIVHRYLDTAKDLGIVYDGKGLDYFFPEGSVRPDLPVKDYVCLAIGGQQGTKRMPLNKLSEIVAGSSKAIIILGGKEDAAVGEQLVAMHPDKPVFNYCGKFTLAESGYAVERAEKLISHDTGMMHIASALRVPILSVWGNTVPEFGMYPFYPDELTTPEVSPIFEIKDLYCRPCSKIGFDKCPKGHFLCMEQQDTAAMAEWLNSSPSEK